MTQPIANPREIELGQIFVTRGAKAELLHSEIILALARHQDGDWGDLCEEDRQLNDDAFNNGGRIISAYHSMKNQKFYIITEWDRSYTTVLLPEEY